MKTRIAFILALVFSSGGIPAQVPKAGNTVLFGVLETELKRAMTELSKRDPAPYFISYSVSDRVETLVRASNGAIFTSTRAHIRSVDISIRIASAELDNTHNEGRQSGVHTVLLPLEDDPAAIARVLWDATDTEYKAASRVYLQMKTNTAVRAKEEDTSADFTTETPQVHIEASAPSTPPDIATWEKKLRQYSLVLNKFPDIYNPMASFSASDVTRYFVSTEGSRVVTHEPIVTLVASADTRAEDGMDLVRSEVFAGTDVSRLPSDAVVVAKIEKLGADVEKLRTAAIVEPYTGPALLSGRAAAVFFHEVLGHRIEGQRQRGVEEGQTFTKKLNQLVLPEFLSVADDPTLRELNGVQLNGAYDYDNEGVKSRRVPVIENGMLKQFLLSRLPVKGFDHSNGHGRAQDGAMPVGRQGNLLISSSKAVPDAELRKMLLEEVKRQGKPYGLFFEDIAGGFTLTARAMPQAFQVLPLVVWRVFADGRPDELVRGVDIVGTPLTAMTRILATGDKTEVFNGICGAESGQVPVAAASPAILFSELEVQKRKQSQSRPPILPMPGVSADAAAGDPVLQAMKAELERSTSKLQLEQMRRPYFIEYRLLDDDTYMSEAAFGATRWEQRSHQRFLRVSVRVGDYKQDSSMGAGAGAGDSVQDLAPVEDSIPALRHRIWLATDSAYKNAIEALTRKQAQLKQFESDQQLPDDFSHEKPAQYIAPLAKLDYDAARWRATLKSATAVYRADPDLQAFSARLTFHVQNKYVVNSEGTVLRQPDSTYAIAISAAAQAPDGRRIDRGYTRVVPDPNELPTEEEIRTAAQKVIETVGALKKATLVDDQYRGPVLLAPDAAATTVARLVGTAVLGRRPRPGTTTRTTGEFATSWKARVLPDFMDITDDPTVDRAAGRTLLGMYKYDDDGVEARPVKLIEHGTLLNFLVGRQPIRDFPSSSGHSRVAGPQGVAISLGNMFVSSSAPATFDDLKKRLLEICKQRELPYGYLAESVSSGRPEPLYRVYVKDGHQELVRGGEFAQLDTRALRNNLIAAGNDANANNLLDGAPHSIIAPSLLFDELEIRKSAAGRDKLPDYPPPAPAPR